MADIVEEFAEVDRKNKGFFKQLFGGARKAREEKMLVMAMHLQELQNSVSSGGEAMEKDFTTLARSLGDQTSFMHSSLSSLSDAEEQLKQASEKRMTDLENTIQKASLTLSAGQTKSSSDLAGRLDSSASKLREVLEATGDSLRQGNAEIAQSIVRVSEALSNLGERLAGVQETLSGSMNKMDSKLTAVQGTLSQSLEKTGKRVDNIADITASIGASLGDFRAESKGQQKIVDEINKQVAKLETEAARLDSDLKQTGASMASGLNQVMGEVATAKQEISGMEGDVREVEAVVKRLPTEQIISRHVRQELGKRLMAE